MTEKKSWLDKVSETVDKAAKAAGEAWDGTADVRKEAWEKTKAAGTTASAAIEEGVEKAKQAYEGDKAETTETGSVEATPEEPAEETAVAGTTIEHSEAPPETDDLETPPANG